jgi:hypothetical protein
MTDDGALPYVSYETFGRQFFELAVTEERVLGGVNLLAGEPIDFGPIGVGPGKIAQITAHGEIGTATASRVVGDEVAFRVVLPVKLDFTVNLQVDSHRFAATLAVPLVLTARAVDGLTVFIDIQPPRTSDIGIDLSAQGLRASILQRVAGVEHEVQRFVARFVAREIEKPHLRKARTINVAGAVSGAWSMIVVKGKDASVADDFAAAAEDELRTAEVPAD